MLSKYSVKKPYTVAVAVILVLILGVVSFGKMNTDLLPSMNLPYAVVMTTYPGASPETVEMMVTKPIEQSMATVTDIENVSSQSRDNVSLVVLEFQETTNMDSATIEIREKLDQISGYWDDAVGKPMIMKLNPDMMPVMVTAVEIEDMDAVEVTDYVKNNIQAEIESIAGVASVSTTGNITERVDVLLREDLIKKTNKKVMKALNGQFEEKEEDLKEAQKELNEGKEALEKGKEGLESGREQLESGKNQLVNGIAQGQQQMAAAEDKMEAGKAEIDKQLAALDEKQAELDEGRTKLEESRVQVLDGLNKLSDGKEGIEKLEQASAALEGKEEELANALAGVTQGIEAIDKQLAALEETPELPDYESLKQQLTAQKAELEAQKTGIEQGKAELTASKEALNEQLNSIVASFGKETVQEALEEISAQSSTLWASLDEIDANLSKLSEGQAQLDQGRAKLEEAKRQAQAGEIQLDSGKIALETQQLLASLQMGAAQSKLDTGKLEIAQNEAKLNEAQTQLDSGKEQLKDAKTQAKENASLSNILTADMIKGLLAGQNFSMPAGYIEDGKESWLVRVGDKIENTEKLEDMVILDLGIDGLEPIRLKDVAEVTKKDDSDSVYARLGSNPGVMLTIEKQTGYSTGDVTDRILERIGEIESEQEKVHFSVLMDQGVYIDLVVDSVMNNMIYGAILAVLILFLFLKDIKPTIVIALSIPISVVTAVVLMYFSGISLNVISLSGLALGIGMLVDNSIVVIENIDRMRQLGVPARKAAVQGAWQVAGAIAASTLTTVCVFLPIVFTEGITRQLFVDMGLTIAYSLFASLIVALTLVPAMSAGLLRKSEPKKHRLLDKITEFYAKILSGALRVKWLVLLLALVLLGTSAVAAIRKGTAFMPAMESTQATMTIIPPEGTEFVKMTEYADDIIASIEDIEDIENIGAMAGGGSASSMMGGEAKSISAYLLLKEDKKLSGEELEKEILARTKDSPCEVQVNTQSMDMSALGGSGIQIQIKGKELDTLSELSKKVAEIVEKTEGTQNVSDGQEDADREYRIIVNKAKAMEHQLTVAQVFQEIQGKIEEASAATTLSTEDKDYSVYVRDEKNEALTRNDLKEMELEVTGADGKKEKVKLSDIADFREAMGPQSISREGQSRYMTVSAEIAPGYNIGLVSDEVEKKLADCELPKGYTAEMKGEDETIGEAMGQLYLMLILALAFMYLIMVAQFQSLLSPFIIMFTIPLAFTGGFMGLLVADQEVSVIAMIGFIMLSGIIVNNGIVLVDYTNQLRAEGMEKREALLRAGKDRLRPIVMTALTTILGLSTMAAGVGMGGDMVQPMAIVTIGGLIYGTLLTLFVVPCIYDLLNHREYKKDELEGDSDDSGNK